MAVVVVLLLLSCQWVVDLDNNLPSNPMVVVVVESNGMVVQSVVVAVARLFRRQRSFDSPATVVVDSPIVVALVDGSTSWPSHSK